MTVEKKGVLYAFLSYAIWGAFPLFWKMLDHVDSIEILLGRVIWAFVFTVIVMQLIGMRQAFVQDIRYLWAHKSQLFRLIVASFVISINWGLYIYAVTHDRLVETSLGYYINPIISVLLGVVIFKEKLSRVQMIATVIACVGAMVLTWNYGSIPWLAICIALSFATYGVIKKQVPLDATRGLVIETMMMLPIALGLYAYIWWSGEMSFLHINWQTDVLMMLGGVVTAIPLILFAKGAQQIPLYLLGFLQYLTPTTILLFGVVVYGEPFSLIELAAFALIWCALLLFSGSMFYESRKTKQA